ncbi:MAG: MFS transporter [Candidatus Hydrogenedentes bacterium]|nr:MFS transporter [Candidatus Hydrogenedentota bacterium]
MFKPHQRHYLVGFILDCAIMIAMTASPFFIMRQLNGGSTMLGVIAAVQAMGYAILCLLSQSFVTRAKHGLNWAVLGVAICGSCFVVMPFSLNPWVFGALTGVSMTALALVWPALHSWIGAEPDLARRGRRVSKFNMAWSLGFTVGPLLTGPLYTSDYHLPFIVGFAFITVTLALLLAAPHERDYFGEASTEDIAARANHDRTSEKHLYGAWVATIVANGLIGATRSVFPKQVEDLVVSGNLRWFAEVTAGPYLPTDAAQAFSWLAFVLSGATAFTFYVLGRTQFWHHRFSFLVAVQVAGAVAFAALGNITSYVLMAVCCVVVGLNLGFCFFAAVYYSLADPARKHQRLAVNEGAVGIGGFVGALGTGLLADRYGMGLPFAGAAVVIAAAVALEYALTCAGRRTSSEGV